MLVKLDKQKYLSYILRLNSAHFFIKPDRVKKREYWRSIGVYGYEKKQFT